MMKNRGITVIALIITIIVLLILAGISISMITGENGILNKAKLSKEQTNAGEIEEENRLGKYNDILDNYTTRSGSSINIKTTLWSGSAQSTGKYMFTNTSDDISNYDEVLIEYAQSISGDINTYKMSMMLETNYIQKDKSSDIGLFGYSTRYTSLHFINNGFMVDELVGDGGSFNYIKRIVGIKN